MCVCYKLTQNLEIQSLKSHYMEIKISVNNNHIIKHLTLDDVTLKYKK